MIKSTNDTVGDSGLAARVARDRDVLLRLLPVMASLAGLCLATLGFLQAVDRRELGNTYADEVIAIDAMLFVGCVYLVLWAARARSLRRADRLAHAALGIFLFALTTLLLAAIYLVYWIL